MRKLLFLASNGLVAAVLLSAAASAEIKIGVAGPLSGRYEAFGAQMWQGARMAVDEINAAGGVNGEKLKLEYADDGCVAEQGPPAARDMAAKKVVMVVGHFCGGASIGASHVYAGQNIIQIEPAATNPMLTEQRLGPGTFRLVPSDRKQALFASAYLAKKFAGKRIAVVGDDSNYGGSMAHVVRQALAAAGQAPVFSESFVGGQSDFSSLAAKLKAAGIDAVYASGYHPEIASLVREMRRQGVTAQLLGPDALATVDFWRMAGGAAEGTLMSFTPDPRSNAASVDIVKKFRARKIEPQGYTLHSYVAVRLWADAAGSAGSVEFAKVTAALAKANADTPIGRISFDGYGDLTEPPLIWYVWHKGKYAPLKSAD
jgi:branched-chain amino acid transport system substrate-binding protein